MKLIIIRGLPGSGKSTLAKKYVEDNGYKHFEADMYFMVNGEYIFNKDEIADAHEWCRTNVFNSLAARENTVVSNTFTKLWEMEEYIDYCKEHDIEFEVIECTGRFENVHKCPEETIQKMKQRWQPYKGGQNG